MHNQRVTGVKLDVVAISGVQRHQVSAPSDRQRPTGKVVAELKDCILGNRIEVVIAVNEFA